MPRMRRQIFASLLFACILLAPSSLKPFISNVQAIPSALHFKPTFRTLQPNSVPRSGKLIPTWVEEKRTRKSPSGPNPVGNQRPPSKT